MPDLVTIQKIAELTEKIQKLPKGYIAKKAVNGNVYFYHQWSENGVKKSRYLRNEEIAGLTEQIEQRKQLQKKLSAIKAGKNDPSGTRAGSLRCTLMHKRTAVADLDLDSTTGVIQKIGEVFAPDHFPVGVGMKNGIADRASLNAWWVDRSIPASRSGVREAMETLKITDTKELLVRCYGLSLSDQYWICPEDSGLTWETVNFFENGFSEDVGNVLFGSEKTKDALNFSSPDSTSDGNLKKRWKIIDGKRYLVKGGSNPYRQQPLNEVIASEIMRRLAIPHVPYTVIWDKGAPYSICEDFIDENTELVPAWRIIQVKKKPNNRSMYQHFIDCAESLGIPDVREFLDRMIVLDYIIMNEDRHLNNFGAIRNAETLEWLGMAPIYDSGSSLGYDKSVPLLRDGSEVICKPFKKHHEAQLKLVSSFDWIDFSSLDGIGEVIREILSDSDANEYMEENRIRVIAQMTDRRIEHLRALAGSVDHRQTIDTEDDVDRDIAASYSNVNPSIR